MVIVQKTILMCSYLDNKSLLYVKAQKHIKILNVISHLPFKVLIDRENWLYSLLTGNLHPLDIEKSKIH